jgi:TRAP-type mannitol/chloroaromatic compound transport system permease large subunit
MPDWVAHAQQAYSRNMTATTLAAVVRPGPMLRLSHEGLRFTYFTVLRNALAVLFPVLLAASTLYGTWWYVVIHQQADLPVARAEAKEPRPGVAPPQPAPAEMTAAGEEKPEELGLNEVTKEAVPEKDEPLQAMGTPELAEGNAAPSASGPPEGFYFWFWLTVALTTLLLCWYHWRLHGEQFVILRLLIESVMPLGILTLVVLAVILFGITTATESAAIGAAGAFLLAMQARTLDWERVKQSVFLTAKTTAMVCWLFVGSALFSAVFAILGGQQLVEKWVLSLNMSPVGFMILSQAIIFLLGWPLEWTEIIVIFVPIFLPLLKHFNIDPILWGTLVFVNLQAAFLSPPVAMSAFYLKGVAPPHVTLNQIFAGMMPYMLIVIVCMVVMYFWPGMTLWLPNYLYGGG